MPTFPVPEGFQLPEGVSEGQDFDAVGTFSLSEGKLMLKAVEDAPIEGYEPEAEGEDEAPSPVEDKENFMSAVEKRMTGA